MAQVLQPLTTHTHPDLLVGLQTSDDAAVLRLRDDLAIVQTVDFFAPVVDDPYQFGAIAAANSMSDVFAMGGTVTMGLNVAAFPDDLDLSVLSEIMRGGADKMAEAGAVIAGGHTVTDNEPKYGLSVTGIVDPSHLWTKAGAKVGDRLYLTKPIGSGVMTTAAKQDRLDQGDLAEAIDWMILLNRTARDLAYELEVHAVTDVTGYGLAGHAWEMAERSGVGMSIDLAAVPQFEKAYQLVSQGVAAGGLHRNRKHFTSLAPGVRVDGDATLPEVSLAFDPQTSGGLLFAIPYAAAGSFTDAFTDAGAAIWEIGVVTDGPDLVLRSNGARS